MRGGGGGGGRGEWPDGTPAKSSPLVKDPGKEKPIPVGGNKNPIPVGGNERIPPGPTTLLRHPPSPGGVGRGGGVQWLIKRGGIGLNK